MTGKALLSLGTVSLAAIPLAMAAPAQAHSEDAYAFCDALASYYESYEECLDAYSSFSPSTSDVPNEPAPGYSPPSYLNPLDFPIHYCSGRIDCPR